MERGSRTVAETSLAEAEGVGPVLGFTVGLDYYPVTKMVLRDGEEGCDGQVVRPEGGFAEANDHVWFQETWKVQRFVGTIAVAGPVG